MIRIPIANVMPHSKMHSHTIIVGGTGMLRAASIHLAAQSRRLTSVARTHISLANLDRSLPERHGAHHTLALDWSDPDTFLSGIAQHIDRTEQPDLLLAWIHDDWLAIRLASMLGKCPLQFFHVIGSASTNPAQIAASALHELRPSSSVAYHQVILGRSGQGARARWLTDKEISGGVIEAIQVQRPQFVVGTLERW